MGLRQWLLNSRRVDGIVRSISTGTVALGASAVAATSAVGIDLANTLVFPAGDDHSTNLSSSDENLFAAYLSYSDTAVGATRGGQNGNDTLNVNFFVVQFWPGVLRLVQHGAASISASPTDVTIAAVSPKAFAYSLGFATNGVTGWDAARMSLTSPTNLRFTQAAVTGGIQGWCVADFY